jgi:AcrR family transcriptional regulator
MGDVVMPARARAPRAAPVSGARARRGGRWPAAPAPSVGATHEQIVEIQRSRLLAAAVVAVDELGYADTTVADITSRARVSRRTFYELFKNREECLAAVLEDVVALIEGEIAAAGLDGLAWRERVRGGLWAILAFLDREPALARVCVVQTLRGGMEVLDRREEIMAGLAAVVDEGRNEGARAGGCTPLTAEGIVGAAFTIVYARLLRGERKPLTGLLGELMGMIVLPYRGAAAARREQARPAPAGPVGAADGPAVPGRAVGDPLEGVSMRLTYRTARVLEGVEGRPGASNREVAERAGIHDPGQVSKLLARLERLGLLENTGEGHAKGEPNAWSLTPKGRRVAQSIRIHAPGEREAA